MSHVPNPGTTLTESVRTYFEWRARTKWTEWGGEGWDPALVFFIHVIFAWIVLHALSTTFPRVVGSIYQLFVGICAVAAAWVYLFVVY